MLTSRTQYQTVKIPYTMKIDGGIMPLREDKEHIRGEDICYMSEWMNRLAKGGKDVFLGSYEQNNEVEHILYGYRYQRIIRWMRNIYNRMSMQSCKPVYANFEFPEYYYSTYPQLAPCEFDQQLEMPITSLDSDDADFARDKPFKIENVLKLHNDIKKIKAVQANYYAPTEMGATEFSIVKDDPNDYIGSYHQPHGSHVFFYRADQQYINRQFIWRWKKWYPTALIDSTFKVPQPQLGWLANKAKAYFQVNISKEFFRDAQHNHSESMYYAYVFPVDCTKTSDGFKVSGSTMLAKVNRVLELEGMGPASIPNPSGYSSDGSEGIREYDVWGDFCDWLIVELNNDIKYDI